MREASNISTQVERENERQSNSTLVAELIEISDSGEIFVRIDGVTYVAQVLSHLAEELGQLAEALPIQVLVSFPEHLSQPVLIGIIQSTIEIAAGDGTQTDKSASIDGNRLQLTAQTEIELRCGSSSIVLKRDGRIVIKGTELLSRASRVNKVKGATVQIN